MEDGLPGGQHVGQAGARADLPQQTAPDVLPRHAEKVQIGLIGKDDAGGPVNDEDALLHGLEKGLKSAIFL